jgi:hypothetical protein
MPISMRTRTAWTGLAAIVLFGGCSMSTWKKEGATPEDMQRDASQCDFEARGTSAAYGSGGPFRGGLDPFPMSGGADSNRAIREMNYINLCMRTKGYEEVPLR